ncbi:DUF3289 family protein [Flavobacterium sp. H122]|uniref:DUF3289 family protein n=1 Tax=Flavobacterium sp. H122 TaxID=2529860 RepID=UPI0010AA1379|nr:DUF3289 family protein [Flavobacterium sp. H122]
MSESGKITIIANNIKGNASGGIRYDANEISNASGGVFAQKGTSKGLNITDNTARKEAVAIKITKLEGPFDDKGKLVKNVKIGEFYTFKATPSRKPLAVEIPSLKWGIKPDKKEMYQVKGAGGYNLLIDNKILIKLRVPGIEEKAKIYAFYNKPSESVSVLCELKKIKLPMLIIQSVGRKGKKNKLVGKQKVSTNETALDLLYNDYTNNEAGFEKLRKELYQETFDVEKQDSFYNVSSRADNAKNKADSLVKKVKKFSENNNDKLFEIFRDESESVSSGKLEANIKRMIQKMQDNEGGEYSHLDLTNAIIEHDNTKVFIRQVKDYVIKYLKENKDDISKLEITDDSQGIIYESDFKTKVDKPRFNNKKDTISGIQIAINDVWAYKISLTKYNQNSIKPEGELRFEFYDHFGLDYPDIQKYDYDIFIAWFILQHFRGYKPFITKAVFDVKF